MADEAGHAPVGGAVGCASSISLVPIGPLHLAFASACVGLLPLHSSPEPQLREAAVRGGHQRGAKRPSSLDDEQHPGKLPGGRRRIPRYRPLPTDGALCASPGSTLGRTAPQPEKERSRVRPAALQQPLKARPCGQLHLLCARRPQRWRHPVCACSHGETLATEGASTSSPRASTALTVAAAVMPSSCGGGDWEGACELAPALDPTSTSCLGHPQRLCPVAVVAWTGREHRI